MEARQNYVLGVVQVLLACLVLYVVGTLPGPWDRQRYLGSLMVLVGFSGIAVARYQLGRSFSIKADAHALVTRGIYAKIRNPIYVFGTVLVAGFVLVIHRPAGWLIVIVIVIMQTIRAHREARVLEAAFGDAYRDYRRKTWF